MFACGKSSDVSFAGEETIGGETVDKILSEAAKLKRKCKSLRTILLETETKRQEEKEFYDKNLALIKGDFETRLSNLQSKNYIEMHQIREYKARETEELSNLLCSAQREIPLQGHLIMSLTEKLDVSANQETPCECRRFRLPSETVADDADQETLGVSARETAEKLIATEKEKSDLIGELHRCREENARLLDQVQQLKHEQQQHENQQHHHPRSPVLGPSSPSLQKGSAGRNRGFIVGSSASQTADPGRKAAHHEVSGDLQRALDEIIELKATIRELVHSKLAVEESVRTVLQDNEVLSRKLELHVRNQKQQHQQQQNATTKEPA